MNRPKPWLQGEATLKQHNTFTLRHYLPLVYLLLIVSCAGFNLDKSDVLKELQVISATNYPPTKSMGKITIKGGGNSQTGFIFLAIDGDKFRIELVDMVGRTTLAIACDGENIVKLDPSSGKRETSKKAYDRFVSLGPLTAPYALIDSLITGTAPPFGAIKKAHLLNGKRVVYTAEPELVIEYEKRVEKISFPTEDGEEGTLTFGPMEKGASAPFVRSVAVSFSQNGGHAEITWKSVGQNVKFKNGFFSFNEPDELF